MTEQERRGSFTLHHGSRGSGEAADSHERGRASDSSAGLRFGEERVKVMGVLLEISNCAQGNRMKL